MPARLGALEYGHPVFEVFRAPRSGDFSAARFYGYRAVDAGPGAQVLARFDDGAPALLERRVGTGRVLMWTSSLDPYWNDLALKPVFLPFVHRMVRYLGAYREPAPWRTVGDVRRAPAGIDGGARRRRRRVVADAVRAAGGARRRRARRARADRAGLLRDSRAGRDAAPAVVVASNVDLAESDLTRWIRRKSSPRRPAGRAATRRHGAQTPPTDDAQEGAQRVWWYLLFAGLLFLAAETIVGNRLDGVIVSAAGTT